MTPKRVLLLATAILFAGLAIAGYLPLNDPLQVGLPLVLLGMVMPSAAITRYELSLPFEEFDLAMNMRGFIGPRVLRPRLVSVQSANVGKIPLEQLLGQKDTNRAPGAGYTRGDFEFTTFSYATQEHGWEEPIDDRTLAVFRDMIDAEAVHNQRAVSFVAEAYERAVAAAVYNTTTWTGATLTTAITNEWDDSANATPSSDVLAAKEKIRTLSGLEANALIMNKYQFECLCVTDEMLDRVKYTQRADMATMVAAVADCLGVEFLLVSGGFTNSANAQATASMARLWSNEYMMVCRVATTDDPREPCIGRTFMFTEENAGVGTDEALAIITEEYRDENVRGSVIRCRNDRDIVIMYAEAGHLLSNAITI